MVEQLDYRGCPICRLVEDTERRVIKSILYEYVNDPGVRQGIRRSWGFCTHHAWLFLRLALSPETAGRLGAAIIYEDLVSTLIESLGDEKALSNESLCPVCRAAMETEEIYVEEFARCYEQSEWFRKKYASSRALLCRKHLISVAKRLGPSARRKLIEREKLRLEDIRKRLTSLINKHDYRNREPITKEEQQALWEAVEALRGREVSTNLCTQVPRPRRSSGPLASLLERITKRSAKTRRDADKES